MLSEVDSVVHFVSKLLSQRKLSSETIDSFREALRGVLCTHYEDHWFPDKPFKGSAYRCLRIVGMQIDPLFTGAGAKVGLSKSELVELLPRELTIWVDPEDVSYRIGEEGSIGILFDGINNFVTLEQENSTRPPKIKSCKEQLIHCSSHSNAEAIAAVAS